MKLSTPMKYWHHWKGITYVIDMEGKQYQVDKEVQDGLQGQEEERQEEIREIKIRRCERHFYEIGGLLPAEGVRYYFASEEDCLGGRKTHKEEEGRKKKGKGR